MTPPAERPNDAATLAQQAERLKQLLRTGGVAAVFQPIMDLARGDVVAYEALSRPPKDSGFNGPAEMFAVAEAAGLLWELEQQTRRACLEAAANWPSEIRLFLNCTPLVFGDPRFAESLDNELRGWAGPQAGRRLGEQIVLEITEQASERSVEVLLQQIEHLRDLGLQVAIDDVGVGASGLSRIMQLRPEWLKLDRGFVERIDADPLKQNMVRFFVHYTRLSGVNVLAEGIETEKELSTLISLGVRFGQGYYLGKPSPRGQGVDFAVAMWARQRWAEAAARADESIQTATIARLRRPALLVQATTPIVDVAGMLDAEPEMRGVVVFDGRRLVGACSTDTITTARRLTSDKPIGLVSDRAGCALAPDSSIAEAMQVVASRAEEELHAPLVVAEGAEVSGVVLITDLIRSAAGVRGVDSSTATGLPGRAAAERELTRRIEAAAHSRRNGVLASDDAAIVDVRRFADFSAAFGSHLAERLLEDVSAMLRSEVVGSDPRFSAWHLGEDRFLVVGPLGSLEAPLHRLMERFDAAPAPAVQSAARMVRHFGAAQGPLAATDATVALRVLLMPGVLGRIATVSDLLRLEHQLRDRARRQGRYAGPSRSILVSDTRDPEVEPTRLTA